MDVPLAALRPEHLDGLYRDLLDHGRNGKPLSGSTVRRIHGIAHRALTIGVRWGWRTTNPATGTMPPRPIRRPITPPSPQDVAALIAAARNTDPALATLLMLAAITGARRGELCGLRWSDLNPAAGELDIVRAVTIVNGRAIVGPTMTRRGRRIHLDRTTLHALAAHRRGVETDARREGEMVAPDGYMFSSPPAGGSPWRPDRVSRPLRVLVVSASPWRPAFRDLPVTPPHDLVPSAPWFWETATGAARTDSPHRLHPWPLSASLLTPSGWGGCPPSGICVSR